MKISNILYAHSAALCLFLSMSLQTFSQSVEVKWNDVHQKITGFGASGGNISAENFMKLSEADREKLCDLFFSVDKGIGLSMVRNELYFLIEPAPGVWDWTKDSAQVWLMNQAKKRGVNYFWSTSWSMPAWMKDNNNVNKGGYLLQSHYQDYADYLSKYVQEYKSRFSIDIRVISPQNEPDVNASYESCLWNATRFTNFIKYNLGPTFARDGIKAKIMIPEPGSLLLVPKFADSAMNDPDARKYIDIIAGHQYNQTYFSAKEPKLPPDTLQEPYLPARQYGKEYWQTEVSFIGGKPDYSMKWGLGTGMLIHNAMVKAEFNAWVWWAFLNSWGDNEGLADLTGNTYKISKRLYSLGNWSKFVRPGYVMIGITNSPAPGLFCTAFKNPGTGEFAIIFINKNSSPVNIPVIFSGIKVDSTVPWVTSETYDLEKQDVVKSNSTKTGFTANIKAYSITTFSGKGY
jgi:glucuronoarabinoxylan endo-1,4-beta-xylanase